MSTLSLMLLALVCVASGLDSFTAQTPEVSIFGVILGALAGATLFAPFFIATHVLGEARRALGVYKPLDSIGAWVSLLYFGFGGVFFIRRTVLAVAESLAKEDRTDQGSRNAPAV